jgi:Protein of unknown function (DUF3499)
VATLTYVYADSTAVLGPLASFPEPHCYDLCANHAEGLTAPRGWQVVRLSAPETGRRTPSSDDLEALAMAVREAARAPIGTETEQPVRRERPPGLPGDQPPRRGHLRAVSEPDAP